MHATLFRPVLLGLALACTEARADLIGDAITVAHHGPTIGEIFGTRDTVVQFGALDQVVFLNPLGYIVDAEGSTFHATFQRTGTFSASPFNGLVVSGIDSTITGYSVQTNFEGWSDSRLTFDAHSFTANFGGLPRDEDTFLTVTLKTTPAHVPDRGRTWVLLAPVVLGMAAISRCFVGRRLLTSA